MSMWFFVSDLHGRVQRYHALLEAIAAERPAVVLLGGDLLPHGLRWSAEERQACDLPADAVTRLPAELRGSFLGEFLATRLDVLRQRLGPAYPRVLMILGNDDPRVEEVAAQAGQTSGFWEYIHNRCVSVGGYEVYGYACVPPTPFLLKDWERYDVSRHVDPGCVPPEEGHRTVPVPEDQVRYGTIQADLAALFGERNLARAVVLFHAPPYRTNLDRAALDGRSVDHVPLDVHVGSVAIRRFIEERQPCVTLHGHIHEAARLTGAWREQIGRTWCFSAAHDGPELALVRFDPADPEQATRVLL
jgi:Icc-related predicted phosphoesterase